MVKKCMICLLVGIFLTACANPGYKKPVIETDAAPEPKTQPDQIDPDASQEPAPIPGSDWRPFKGVLLEHIVANCCFSESQNTVILGQDNNGDQKVDRCYQLKGKEGEIYYRTLECPEDLAPVKAPQPNNLLQCSLN